MFCRISEFSNLQLEGFFISWWKVIWPFEIILVTTYFTLLFLLFHGPYSYDFEIILVTTDFTLLLLLFCKPYSYDLMNYFLWQGTTTVKKFAFMWLLLFVNLGVVFFQYKISINPNQTVLFLPLRNCGGEESRRRSFCHIILLSFKLGHLFLSTDIN